MAYRKILTIMAVITPYSNQFKNHQLMKDRDSTAFSRSNLTLKVFINLNKTLIKEGEESLWKRSIQTKYFQMFKEIVIV
jgi:hypothetical protein